MAQINGWDINKNVYDMVVPEVDSNIVRMMKTFAIRELNHQRDAFRIGTFNIYINNTRSNRPTIKKELETYGIDMCCFQEARNLSDNNEQINIGDYLKGWQFGYCNTNVGTSGNGRAMVSAYEILSSEEVTFTDNTSNSYLKCVIQLPRYKDYADGLTTLSLYTYHGNVTSATTRTAEVAQMLSAIAQDSSDFIIVTGDTNDFSANKDVWTQFQTAGLTPVHDGKSETVTERNNSIDNIFVSNNITCLYYDVINSSEWMFKPTPTSSPIPVSDHDLLYADLKFDFETVISARQ
jgi:endonuclease/exonuclease/phosphatase family metal-dependent hydrolase